MNRSLKTRVLSMILAVVMLVGLIPMNVFATETETESTTPETVVVKFDVNGGVGEYEDQEVIIGNVIAKPEADPTHETATFAYWTADLEANEEWNFEEDVVAEEMTLYASWTAEAAEETESGALEEIPAVVDAEDGTQETEEAETFLVTFDANSGTGTMEIQVLSSGKLNKNAFTRATSKFVGWNTKPNGTGTAYADEAEITLTENITLYAQWDDIYYNTISETQWDIAPGITEKQIVLNNDAGDYRQVLFVMEADLNNEYVKVINSYTGMKPQYGNYQVSGMTNQAAIAEEMGYGNVVGAMNTTLSWYSNYAADRVNEPLGFIMVDAEIFFDPGNCGYTYGNVGFPSVLVINKDFDENGNPRPADIPKVEMPQIRSAADLDGWEEQVIPASSGYIVKDGINQYASKPNHTDSAPRSVVGIKPDGTVVIMVNDGRQSPYSIGMSMYELAEVMLDLGCTYAVNCDGGGSTTWVSQRPGEEQKINNSPSDGAERSTTTGILFISTAPANGELYRAHISSEDTYYTPGSSVQFHALGTDMGGTEVEIPADAHWQLSDASFGTIDNTGLFTSNGKEGEVAAQLVYNGEVVGEAVITIVVPEIAFKNETIVIGYGDAMMLPIEVTTNGGRNTVTYGAGDIVYTLSNEALGTIVGDQFTACDETAGLTSGTITAYICGQEENAVTAEIRFGKASEIAYDFENGEFIVDTSLTGNIGGDDAADTGEYIYGWHITDTRLAGHLSYRFFSKKSYTPVGYDIPAKVYLVDSSTGKVRNGNYAMGIDIDWTWVTASCHGQMDIFLPESLDLTDATRVGFWMYVPAELVTASMQVRATFMKKEGGTAAVTSTITDMMGANSGVENGGWYYFSWEVLDTYKSLEYFEINSHYTAGTGNYNYYQDLTFYVDDITVDYSDATIDRENPYFTSMTIADEFTSGVEVSGQTITSNTITLMAQAYENTAKANATGLDRNSVKLYVDGVLSNAAIATSVAGTISVSDLYLNDGVHTLVMEISDNQGNVGNIVRKIVVNTEKSAVRLEVPASDKLLPTDSIYWVNLVADDLAAIESVTTTVNLDYVNDWELEGMEIAYGFKAEYYVNVHNDAVITFTRTGDEVADTTILAKLPVRIWTAKGWLDSSGIRADYISNDPAKQDKYHILTPHAMWYSDGTRDYRLVVSAEAGAVTFVDGSTMTFSANETVIQTEMNRYYTNADRQGKWSFHIHTAGEAQDLAATCTTAGYTGRVFCVGCACGSVENLGAECDTHNGCGSVIDWGTVVPATGHSYDFDENGVLKCVCGDLFTGIHTDGKEYVDGVTISNGWVGESYYVNGEKLNGIHKVSAPDGTGEFYYDFGENGICEGKTKFNGIFLDGDVYRYSYLGLIKTGWNMIGEDWYYFRSSTEAAAVGRLSFAWMFEHDVYYEFDETGKLVKGAWIDTDEGTMYYYGPAYHKHGWKTIDGKSYYFHDNYCYKGYRYIVAPNSTVAQWYDFGEDGALVAQLDLTGYVVTEEGPFYLVDGVSRRGLFEYEGGFYYVKSTGKLATGTYVVSTTNGLMPAGEYQFDETGRMILKNGLVEEDGIVYYYVNDVKTYGGLVKIGDDLYYIRSNYRPAVGSYYVSKTNNLLPAGVYNFAEDGKMIQGVVEVDGALYYYENGVKRTDGMFRVGDDYYYARSNGQLAVGVYGATRNNDLLPNGYYTFGEDGKMLQGVVEIDGVLYYYELGNKRSDGLFQVGTDYYYARGNGQLAIGEYYAGRNNNILPATVYTFGADGKMLQGVVEIDGALYYYETGIMRNGGMFQVGNDYYYARSNGQLAIGEYGATRNNNLLPNGYYTFGADGKMLNGIVELDGKLYYYDTGVKTYAGLIEIGGDLYYVRSNYQLATGKYFVSKTNDLLAAGYYTFDADGKLVK